MDLLAFAEDHCRAKGVRLTAQRRHVLEIIGASARPLGAYEILEAMRNVSAGATPPTVYRALDFLLEQGLVHKLETKHSYMACHHPEHPHFSQFLICEDCGDVTELEDSDIAKSINRAASATGFTPQRRVIEVAGTCAQCVSGHPVKP